MDRRARRARPPAARDAAAFLLGLLLAAMLAGRPAPAPARVVSMGSPPVRVANFAHAPPLPAQAPLPVPRAGVRTLVRGDDEDLRLYVDDSARGIAVCRVPRACVDTEGVLFVPQAFEKYAAALGVKCGLHGVRYFREGDVDSRVVRVHEGMHLVGVKPMRFHMPHLVEDFLKSVLKAGMYLRRESDRWRADAPAVVLTNVTVHCYRNARAQDPVPCGVNPPSLLTTLVHKRARDTPWAPGFFAFLANPRSKAPVQALFTDEAFPPELTLEDVKQMHQEHVEKTGKGNADLFQSRRACFASVSVPTSLKVYPKIDELVDASPMFKHIALQRSRPPAGKQKKRCTMNVTIINRPVSKRPRPGFSSEARRIPNVSVLVKELKKRAGKLGISINIIVRQDFGDSSFQSQLEAMQNTHSLISVHGAELTNGIFLRKETTVVEIMPFRYTPAIFANMLAAFSMNVKQYIAEPDVESFEKCIRHFNRQGSNGAIPGQLAVSRFKFASKLFRGAKDLDKKHALAMHWETGNTVGMIRPCGRGQRLLVNPGHVARLALSEHTHACLGTKMKVEAE